MHSNVVGAAVAAGAAPRANCRQKFDTIQIEKGKRRDEQNVVKSKDYAPFLIIRIRATEINILDRVMQHSLKLRDFFALKHLHIVRRHEHVR